MYFHDVLNIYHENTPMTLLQSSIFPHLPHNKQRSLRPKAPLAADGNQLPRKHCQKTTAANYNDDSTQQQMI